MLAAETDTEADAAPIGAAHWDLARDLRRRIAADDEAYLRAVDAISQPVIERLRRHPGRSLRPAMLADFVQQWISTEHRLYRLDLHAKLERVRATLTERRLCAGKVRRVDDPLSSEDDIAVNEVELVVDKADVRLQSRCLCTFSLNAVARYWQRSGATDEESLMRDMDMVATADRSELVAGAGFKVSTDANGGGWRGRAVLQDGLSVIAIRTWLPE
jgi:hypothetical protein